MKQLFDLFYQVLDGVLGLSATTPAALSTAQVCARAILVYLALIWFIRMGKKRFLGQATALDMILVIVIGSVASRAISGTAPFGASLAATVALIGMHWVLSYLTRCSPWLSSLVKGNTTPLIKRGVVDKKALKAAHMSNDDLEEDLRMHGVDQVAQVRDARLERSGKMSVIKN